MKDPGLIPGVAPWKPIRERPPERTVDHSIRYGDLGTFQLGRVDQAPLPTPVALQARPFDSVPEAYANLAAFWWEALCTVLADVVLDQVIMVGK